MANRTVWVNCVWSERGDVCFTRISHSRLQNFTHNICADCAAFIRLHIHDPRIACGHFITVMLSRCVLEPNAPNRLLKSEDGQLCWVGLKKWPHLLGKTILPVYFLLGLSPSFLLNAENYLLNTFIYSKRSLKFKASSKHNGDSFLCWRVYRWSNLFFD